MSTDSTALNRLIPFSIRDAFSEPEQLLNAYFHESTVGLCIHDTEFRYLAINPALAEMHGVPAEAHLGKTSREILGDLADKVELEFKRILATGQPVVGFEISGHLPARGDIGYWSANYFPIKDTAGKVKQIGAVVVEITKRRELEQSLRQLADSLQQEKARLQALQEVDSAMGATLDLGELLNRVSEALQKAVPHASLGIHLYDERTALLRDYGPLTAAKRKILPPGGILSLDDSIAGQVFLERKPRVVEHPELVNIRFPTAQRAVAQGVRSLCFIPLSTGKGLLGVLALSSRTDYAFGTEQIAILEPAAAAIAQAVGNAQAHAALQLKKTRLQTLRDIDDALVSSLDLNHVLPSVSRCLHDTLPHDYVSIYVYDEGRNGLRDYAATSAIKKRIIPANGVIPLDTSLTGRAFVEGQARVYNYSEMAKVPYATTQRALEVGIRSACFIPLSGAQGRVGVLTVSTSQDDAFRHEDLEFLQQVAAALGQALQNALVHKALQEEKRRLQGIAQRQHQPGCKLECSRDLSLNFGLFAPHLAPRIRGFHAQGRKKRTPGAAGTGLSHGQGHLRRN
jgi:PAS domain S-box-containing protein